MVVGIDLACRLGASSIPGRTPFSPSRSSPSPLATVWLGVAEIGLPVSSRSYSIDLLFVFVFVFVFVSSKSYSIDLFFLPHAATAPLVTKHCVVVDNVEVVDAVDSQNSFPTFVDLVGVVLSIK